MKKDSTTVAVNGNFEQALATLRNRVAAARTMTTLRQRKLYPNRAARKRARVKANAIQRQKVKRQKK